MKRVLPVVVLAFLAAIIGLLVFIGVKPGAAGSGRNLGDGLAVADDGDPAPASLTAEEAEGTLRAAEVKRHVGWLASDEMRGRDTPSPELDRAAQYVVAEFRRLGLQGAGGAGYLHWWTHRNEQVPNCLGLLEGSDPTLKSEVVIVGGHMDHIGMQGREAMNGADDNASGTTGVLELAEAFASMKTRPKRSILFMTFSGEEKGLLGSAAYCATPAIAIESCVAMFNFDMIGRSRDNYLFVGGIGTSPEFPAMLERGKTGLGLAIETAPGGYAPSDSENFHKAGLPVLFFFTNVHADYHRPDDIVDKINAEGEQTILRLAFRMIRETADRPARLPFTHLPTRALPKDFDDRVKERDTGTPAPKRPRLGVQRDESRSGFVVAEVTPGGAAEKAGIRLGDEIVRVGEGDVQTYDDLRAQLEKVERGQTVKVVVKRDGAEVSIDVTFE